jgi:hypothetical protein
MIGSTTHDEPRPAVDGPTARIAVSPIQDRYIDLLQNALTMSLWHAADGNQMPPLFAETGATLREDGRDWPNMAHTMIGRKRMRSLRFCVEDVLARNVPGDFIETGVWRGGSCIFMRGILEAYGVTDRKVWVADSFEGLPPPDDEKYPSDTDSTFHLYPQLAVSKETVEDNFRQYGLLDEQVVMLKGFFRDSLPNAPVEQLAILRLDGDMYESTMDSLTNLYSKLSDGGYVIVDDYAITACRQAIKDFRNARGITDFIEVVDWTGVFWRKGSGPSIDTNKYEKLFDEYERTVTANLENELEIARLQARIVAHVPAASLPPSRARMKEKVLDSARLVRRRASNLKRQFVTKN